ncbi:TetR/AcrR family transcriptional regulator [Allokutzneria albata]|uniref:DNA-binding transcriptional regulator, AcrR family n=1 Tax=Allokutzneria albata TaxID=211114 RepID=A0A1G9RLP0_ALLAB|nr:TetR/AcrR family transcriptional regulator [Allokutzneria albata]SDM24041.1 DNA-binding transcriptional regulator, AcrR family [Allokutzneria albata]
MTSDSVTVPAPGRGRVAERADAARNRRKILDAAGLILQTRGAAGLSMDEVARMARVGVGTVYRRFGDLSGLAHALLSEQELQFQESLLTGPAPLGPGAPPKERIAALMSALVDRLEENSELLLVAETSAPYARFTCTAYEVHHAHLVALIGEVRADVDAEFLADALLAPLATNLYLHQRRVRGLSTDRIRQGLAALLAPL